MANDPQRIQDHLVELRRDYGRRLTAKIKRLEILAQELLQNPADRSSLITLHRLSHTLAGSGTTFGFASISCLARTLELFLVPLLQQADPLTPEQQAELQTFFSRLQQAADLPPSLAPSLDPFPALAAVAEGVAKAATKVVFLVEDDLEFAKYLAAQLWNAGYFVQTFSSLETLAEAVQQSSPTAIIADIQFPDGNGAEAIAQIQRSRATPIPTIFISIRNDLIARLQAIRAMSQAYFSKPVNIPALLAQLEKLTQPPECNPDRVLIVDDDLELAQHYALVLQSAGMLTWVESNPLQVLNALLQFQPDLMLLDLYMPECDGLELAQVIRYQQDYLSLPIIFLSVEDRLDKRLAAVNLGAEDFVTKPIASDYLVSLIQARIQRARSLSLQKDFYQRLQTANQELQDLANTDCLTQVANRRQFDQYLAREWKRLEQEGLPLSIILCDVDYFKLYNDAHGHLAGDACLQRVAHSLRQVAQRPLDLVARYGGEEFAFVLPHTDAAAALRLAATIHQVIQRLQISHYQSPVSNYLTLSLGLASLVPNPDLDPEILIELADQALYEAKAQGRDRTVVKTFPTQG